MRNKMKKKTITFEYWSFDHAKGCWEKEPPKNKLLLVSENGEFWFYIELIAENIAFISPRINCAEDDEPCVSTENIKHWAFPPIVPSDDENEQGCLENN